MADRGTLDLFQPWWGGVQAASLLFPTLQRCEGWTEMHVL